MRPLIVDHLRDTLIEKQGRNPQYSLRSFARDLELSSGKLSEILRSKTKLTMNAFEQMSNKLNLEDTLYDSMKKELQEFNEGRSLFHKVKINEDKFVITNDHLALLGLINLSLFQSDLLWISTSLKRSIEQIEILINDLISAKLVIKDEKGIIKTSHTGGKVSPPNDKEVTEMLKNGFLRASEASLKYGEEQHWFTNMIIPAPKAESIVMGKKFWNVLT